MSYKPLATKPTRVFVPVAALALLFVTTGSALAEIRQTTISQSTFVSRCASMGGTIDTGGTPQIKICKLPSGQTVACDFSTSPAYCDVSRMTSPLEEMLGTPPDRVKNGGGKAGIKGDTAPATAQ